MRYTLEEIIQQMGEAREVLEDSETKELYLSCLTEMAGEIISDMLTEAWSAPELLAKWSGTPWHYKRLQKALEAAALDVLPEGSQIDIYAPSEPWFAVAISAWCPVPGDDAERDTKLLGSFMPLTLADRVGGRYRYQAERGQKTSLAISRLSTSFWMPAAMSRRSSESAPPRLMRQKRRPRQSARGVRSGSMR